MGKILGKLFLFLWLLGYYNVHSQQCPTLTSPLDGDIDVPVDNLIRWTPVDGIIGYLVSLGTTPGGGEIINRRSSGLNNFYQPEIGLPENTTVYVTISLFLPDAPILVCPLKVFTTVDITDPPECTTLSQPLDNEIEVSVDGNIKWNYAPGATNYLVSLGTSSGNYDIVENFETGNTIFYRPEQNLELDQTYFFRIIPFNENGEAVGCQEESFTTGVPTVRCESANFPMIMVPDKIALCRGTGGGSYQTTDRARGFRWIKINGDGTEEIVSETNQFEYETIGRYRLELFNTLTEFGASIECLVEKEFEVVYSEQPVIENVFVSRQNNALRIEISVTGAGEYEYALDNNDLSFQESPVFTNVEPGERMVFVRDKKGCGITDRLIEKELSVRDFPTFFTPNGDGINDFWQYRKGDSNEINIEYIHIFDRYGNLLAQLDPLSTGWDGEYNGKQLPANDYWFKAISFSNKQITGHFSLKR